MAIQKQDDTIHSAIEASAGQFQGSPVSGAPDSRSAGSASIPHDERRRRIAEAAYYRAERRGFSPGQEEADWLEAERELTGGPGASNEAGVDDLNRCLRSELSALETYRQALDKMKSEHTNDAKFLQLSGILDDHREAASRLRALVQQRGGTPSEDAGAWGTWSRAVMGAAKLLGDKAALKALKEGEESGIESYRRITDGLTAPIEVKNALAPLLARQQEHIRRLDALLAAA